MSSYGYYEGEYRDGRRLKVGPTDWFLLAGYIFVAIAFFVGIVSRFEVLTNAASLFLIGALPFWVVRAYTGISWKTMTIGVMALPVLVVIAISASIDAGLIGLGIFVVAFLLAVLFRRQLSRTLPQLTAEVVHITKEMHR